MTESSPDVLDQVRRRLDALAASPVEEHAATYTEVHRLLEQALARLDEG